MATQYYVGVNFGTKQIDAASSGTSSTAASIFEFRMGDATYVPTKQESLQALEVIKRWIMNDGLNGAGAGLPPGV